MPIEEESIKGLLSTWGLAAKPCDSCKTAAALLFCRADAAFLCRSCDAKLHNPLSSHERVWVCEVCEQAPASVTCKADAAALCSSCDHDIHSANPLARRHQRLPVVPFLQTPPFPANNILQPPSEYSWSIPDFQGKLPGNCHYLCSSEIDSFFDSGSPDPNTPIVKNRDHEQTFNVHRSYVAGAGSDSVVPTQAPKSSTHLNSFYKESCFEIDFTQSKLSPFNFSAQCLSQSVSSSSDVGIVPDGNSNSSMSEVSNFTLSKPMMGSNVVGVDGGSTAEAVQLSRTDREARVMRYREKRKNRKFEKTIRYASRKAYAESRPRIKGRFARRTDGDGEVDHMYGSAANGVVGEFMVEGHLYGTVPSF